MSIEGMKTVTNEEAEKADAVVCVRVADLPPLDDMHPGLRTFCEKVRARSAVEQCSICGEDVLVDTLSPRTPPRICMPCVIQMDGATRQ